MSLVQKIAPVGIDTTIDSLQVDLFNELTTTAGWTNYESFHRVYKNPKKGSIIPEQYLLSDEYEEVLFNDKFNVSSFFLVDDNVTSDGSGLFTQTISVIFQSILPNLYPAITHRADAEQRDDIMRAFDTTVHDVTTMITGVDNVYSDLSLINKLKEKINLTDMSDFHVSRYDFDALYSYDCKYREL